MGFLVVFSNKRNIKAGQFVMTIAKSKIRVIKGIFSCLEQFIQKVRFLNFHLENHKPSCHGNSSASILRTLQLLLCNQRSIRNLKSYNERPGSPIIRILPILHVVSLHYQVHFGFSEQIRAFVSFLCSVPDLLRSSQTSDLTETVSRSRPGEKFI